MVFIAIGVLLFWLALRKQDLNKMKDDLMHANYWWALVSLIFAMLSNLSRAIRWNMLIEPLGYKPRTFNTFSAVMIAYFANLAIPRAGEVSRCAVLNRYEKVPVETLLGTVVVERVVDVISLFLILVFVIVSNLKLMTLLSEKLLNLIGEKISSLAEKGIVFYAVVAAVILILIFGIVFFMKKFRGSTAEKKFRNLLIGFADGIKTVGKMKNRNYFLLHTFFIWTAYTLMAYVVFFALPATSNLSFMAAIAVMVFGGIGFVIPSPGGSGSYQIFVAAVLIFYGMADHDANSFAIISWTTQTIAVIIFGTLCWALLPFFNRNYSPIKHAN